MTTLPLPDTAEARSYGSVAACASMQDSPDCVEWGRPGQGTECGAAAASDTALLLVAKDGKRDELKPRAAATASQPAEKRSVLVAAATLLLSLPALIGMWCWPALVIPLLGGTVTRASRHLSHTLSLVATAVLMVSMSVYVAYEAHTKRRPSYPRRTAWYVIYGPTVLVAVGACLILADPLRHFLQDQGYWTASMYISDCPARSYQSPKRPCVQSSDCGVYHCGGEFYADRPGEDCFTCWMHEDADTAPHTCSQGAETFACLSAIGWTVTVVCTYVGFVCFAVGVVWNTNLHLKMKHHWRTLRQTSG